MKILWSPTAIADLRAIRAYIAKDNPTAAHRVALSVRDAVERLAQFPNSGRVGRVEETRELVIAGLPFIAVYTASRNKISIASVLHGSRNWPSSF
jgi:toxin ParE1/3/4